MACVAEPLEVEGGPGLGAGVVIHSLRLQTVPGQQVDPAPAACPMALARGSAAGT